MRTSMPGIRAAAPVVEVRFRGRALRCRPGDTIAAALVDAGELGCRETADGSSRGVFCGMGVCQECLVQVDGRPGVRACMTPVRDGMRIARQPARPALAEAPDVPASDARTAAPEVLVVGAGPAGLAAAAAAAEAGCEVLLIDERPKLGGQYYKQPAAATVDERALDAQFRAGRALLERMRRAGVTVRSGLQVWGAFGERALHAAGDGGHWTLLPQRIVLASGAFERGVPLPGWTLPGVMTTGAAQTLTRAHQVAAGTRVLVSGHGPLNMQVAAELVAGGATVVALAELARPARRPAAIAAMALAAPDLVRDGLRYRAALLRARVPVLERHAVVRCEGGERVERAVVARIGADGRPIAGTERAFAVDAVCVGFGFQPAGELARALGCRHDVDGERRELVPVRDAVGRSTVDGVWIAGDAAGIGGARLAQLAGLVAGADVAASLGRVVPAPLREELAAASRRRRSARAFQRALARAYSAPRLVDQLATADTLVCRCEAVSRGTIDAALREDVAHIGAVKRATRAGMGGCQGRYCASTLAEMTAARAGRELDERAWFAPAAPLKPVAIAAMAPPD